MLEFESIAVGSVLETRGFEPVRGVGTRRWRGRVDGREVDVFLVPTPQTQTHEDVGRRRALGCRLEVRMSIDLAVRAVFVPEALARVAWMRWLWRWKKMEVLASPPVALSSLRLVAYDASWARNLLESAAAVDAMVRLQSVDPGATSGTISFSPGAISWLGRFVHASMDATATFEALFEDLSALADAAQRLPPPTRPAVAGPFARWAASRPLLVVLVFFALSLALLALIGAVMRGLFLGIRALV
jgi:hypothetical protein